MNNSKFTDIKYVAFDFCGTLADLSPSTSSIVDQFVSDNYSIEVSKDHLSTVIRRTSREMPYSSISIATESARADYFMEFNTRILQDIGCEPPKAFELYRFFSKFDRHWQIKSEVPAILETLKLRGYELIIASNFDRNLNILLQRLGIYDFFCNTFVSATLGVEKPSVEFYERIPKALSCSPREIVMVGDDLFLDIYPSLATGLHGVHIENNSPKGKVDDVDGFLKITSVSMLLDVLP